MRVGPVAEPTTQQAPAGAEAAGVAGDFAALIGSLLGVPATAADPAAGRGAASAPADATTAPAVSVLLGAGPGLATPVPGASADADLPAGPSDAPAPVPGTDTAASVTPVPTLLAAVVPPVGAVPVPRGVLPAATTPPVADAQVPGTSAAPVAAPAVGTAPSAEAQQPGAPATTVSAAGTPAQPVPFAQAGNAADAAPAAPAPVDPALVHAGLDAAQLDAAQPVADHGEARPHDPDAPIDVAPQTAAAATDPGSSVPTTTTAGPVIATAITGTAPVTDRAQATSVAQQVAARVADVVQTQSSGSGPSTHRLSLRLDPPHLGPVGLVVTVRGDQLHVAVEASSEVRAMLQAGSGDLRSMLAQLSASDPTGALPSAGSSVTTDLGGQGQAGDPDRARSGQEPGAFSRGPRTGIDDREPTRPGTAPRGLDLAL